LISVGSVVAVLLALVVVVVVVVVVAFLQPVTAKSSAGASQIIFPERNISNLILQILFPTAKLLALRQTPSYAVTS
jgi:preprotein translocase subunit SecG